MATEIERKFLVKDNSWQSQVEKQKSMRQGYMVGSEKASVRVRLSDDRAWLNIKSATLGVTRQEYELDLPVDDANEMLDTLCEKPLIEKTRHYVRIDKHLWEIDVFEGDNAGLVVAEIELADKDEAFLKPDWLGEEVSEDPRYYNVCLARHPYKDW